MTKNTKIGKTEKKILQYLKAVGEADKWMIKQAIRVKYDLGQTLKNLTHKGFIKRYRYGASQKIWVYDISEKGMKYLDPKHKISLSEYFDTFDFIEFENRFGIFGDDAKLLKEIMDYLKLEDNDLYGVSDDLPTHNEIIFASNKGHYAIFKNVKDLFGYAQENDINVDFGDKDKVKTYNNKYIILKTYEPERKYQNKFKK